MIVKFATHYPHECQRDSIQIADPSLYTSQLSRQRGYAMRAIYEFKYNQLMNGICFFLTFTFNDNSVFEIYNNIEDETQNYCNNTSFRLFLVNYLYKQVERKFNCTFKYFCTGELGEGKGARGYANNPHFHVIFYLYPKDTGTALPTEKQFLDLVRSYWQHSDPNVTDPKQYRYGIVSTPTNHTSILQNEDAIMYVAKYVTKDAAFIRKRQSLRNFIKGYLLAYSNTHSLNAQRHDISYLPHFHKYDFNKPIKNIQNIYSYIQALRSTFNLDIETLTDIALKRLSNYLLPKVMLSQGLGLYAESFVTDWTNPKLPYKTGKGIKYFPVPLYIYRKHFYEVEYNSVTDEYGGKKVISHYKHNANYRSIFCDYNVFRTRFLNFCTNLQTQIRPYLHVNPQNIADSLEKLRIISTPFRPALVYFKDFSSITYDDIIMYHAYYFIYFGRQLDTTFIPLEMKSAQELLPRFHCDLVLCEISSYNAKFTPELHSLKKIRNNYFERYFNKFTLINLLLTYFSYFKNDELFQKNDEWRKIRRSHFALCR